MAKCRDNRKARLKRAKVEAARERELVRARCQLRPGVNQAYYEAEILKLRARHATVRGPGGAKVRTRIYQVVSRTVLNQAGRDLYRQLAEKCRGIVIHAETVREILAKGRGEHSERLEVS